MTESQKQESFARAVSSTMFLSELAYEIAYRWTGIVAENKEMFHHETKRLLNRFRKTMTDYNGWVLRATGTSVNLSIIRNISDELNSRVDDELYKFRLAVEGRLKQNNVPYPQTFAMLEIMYYTVAMANVGGKEQFASVHAFAPGIERYYHMRMDAPMKALHELRAFLHRKYVEECIDLNHDGMIENGISAIIRTIMDNCNEVCAGEDVQLPPAKINEENHGKQ